MRGHVAPLAERVKQLEEATAKAGTEQEALKAEADRATAAAKASIEKLEAEEALSRQRATELAEAEGHGAGRGSPQGRGPPRRAPGEEGERSR